MNKASLSKRFKKLGLFFAALALALLSTAELAPAFAQAGAGCSYVGNYSVEGQSPGASGTYQGRAVITSKEGGGCYVVWYPPNDSTGTGYYANGVLTINFTMANGAQGVVQYSEADDDYKLVGVWWLNGNEANKGWETLTLLDDPY